MKKIFLIAVFVFSLTGLSFAQTDSDSDGVFDGVDLCEDTVFPESVPWTYLGPDSFALTNNDTIFDTTVQCGQSEVESSYSLNDTCGCSCEQVLSIYYKNMYSQGSYQSYFQMYIEKYLQLNFGCRSYVLDGFIEDNCPADNNEPVTCDGVPETDPNVCLGRGDCKAQDTCECDDGYFGSNCENEKECNGVSYFSTETVCSGHGACELDGTCSCSDDYDGLDCDNYIGITCYGKHPSEACGLGVCVAQDECLCPEGYIGDECEIEVWCNGVFKADDTVCSAQGTCNNDGTCTCFDQWEGVDCDELPPETFACFGHESTDFLDVCNGRGVCTGTDTCDCDEGWTGDECTTEVPDMCYGVYEYDSAVCGGHGTCVDPDVCLCDAEWSGAECKSFTGATCYGTPNNDPGVCSGNGVCTATDTCVCNAGYEGQWCQTVSSLCPAGASAVVMFDFDGTDEEELSVIEGENIIVLKDIGEWLFVCKLSTGEQGYVPTTYVEQQ